MRKKQVCILASFLSFVILLIMMAEVSSGEKASADAPQIRIAVAADLHYIAPELTDGGESFTRLIENGDGKAMKYCEAITDAFLEQIVTEHPDVLILAGDLTFNGAKASHTALASKLQGVEDAGIPILVIPGNHDLNNSMAASFQGDTYTLVDSIDADLFSALYTAYGYADALARDTASLSYVCELLPGLRFLMLDVNTAQAPGSLTEETFLWVRNQLKEAQQSGCRMIAVSHQKLLAHNSLFTDGFMMGGSSRLLSLYEEYRVLCNLSGHIHIQHIGISPGGIPEFVTSALSVSPHHYGILELDGSVLNYHTEELLFPFSDETEQFFRDSSFRKASEQLSAPSEQLCLFFADVNTAYFQGRTDLIAWDDSCFEEILSQNMILGLYLQSIRDDGFQDFTKLRFSLRES